MQTQTETHQQSTGREHAEARSAETRVTYLAPPVDILESDDEWLVVADIPGVKKEDLTIGIEKETLTFVGRRAAVKGSPDVAYRRSFSVPREIDLDRIEALLENGVLELHLPRHASAKPRQIAVRSK